MKTIATLVKVYSDSCTAESSVYRSFTRLDDRAETDIRQTIRNGVNEEFTETDIDRGFLCTYDKLRKEICVPGTDEFLNVFSETGCPVWNYCDGIIDISFVLHLSYIDL